MDNGMSANYLVNFILTHASHVSEPDSSGYSAYTFGLFEMRAKETKDGWCVVMITGPSTDRSITDLIQSMTNQPEAIQEVKRGLPKTFHDATVSFTASYPS